MSDRWHCDWCTYAHPVATMVSDHETACTARPVEVEDAA